jgi:rfaE bifunctional protein kinase chain/domain
LSLEPTPEQERLTAYVRRFPQKKIVVVGDIVADQFLYGAISRVSREAPVLILRYEQTQTVPGGAANCAVNLASLDARAFLIGLVGNDEAGQALVGKLCEANVVTDGILQSQSVRTTTKVRVLAGQLHSTRQQVIRIDYEGEPTKNEEIKQRLLEKLRETAEDADAIIISDYNYGVANESLAAAAREIAVRRGIPLLVDSRFQLASYQSCTSATPNEDEVEQLLDRKMKSVSDLENACSELCERLGFQSLLVTRGGHGMMLIEPNKQPMHIEAVGSREPVDVTGAGDTVIATYTLALASSATFSDAANLANYAGGLVVMKRGTASITRQELLSSVLRWAER